MAVLFEEMCSPERKAAFLLRREGSVNADPEETERLRDYLLSERFDGDVRRIRAGDYPLEPPTLIFLRKCRSDRRRKVYRFTEENKYLLQYLNYMLMERYDGCFPDSLYSFRKHNPKGQLFRRILREDPRREKWVVKADVHRFGESIDPEILRPRLERFLAEEREVYDFILWMITRNRYYRAGRLEEGFTSVLPGNPLVPFLQNVFLLEVDDFMRENVRFCSRYTDDIWMLCDDEETAERLMRQTEEKIRQLGLTLNVEKSAVVPPGKPYDLLGLRFAPDSVDIADNTWRKVAARMKHRADRLCRKVREGRLCREEALERMTGFIRNYYYSTDKEDRIRWTDQFFPYITTAERLKRLDRLSQECLRYTATGRRTNAKYRFRYADIRGTGYVPLVRAYYSRMEGLQTAPSGAVTKQSSGPI